MIDHKHQIKTEINKLKNVVSHHYKLRHSLSSPIRVKEWIEEIRNKQSILKIL